MTESITLQAPAKINLFLKVLGKRPDGYHDIYSLVQAISLYDTLTFAKTDGGIEILSNLPELANSPDNLVWRAIELLQKEVGFAKGVKVDLVKRIPIGAGLGGGSSDAAATLKGLNRLFALGLTNKELQSLSARLGSDIPFFFSHGFAIISGRGEIVEDIDLDHGYQILLVAPDFAIQTAWAYAELRFPLTKSVGRPTFNWEVSRNDFCELLRGSGNDFQELVINNHPLIFDCMKVLKEYGASYIALSGSGAAFFGLFDHIPDSEAGELIADRFGWQVHSLHPVSMS